MNIRKKSFEKVFSALLKTYTQVLDFRYNITKKILLRFSFTFHLYNVDFSFIVNINIYLYARTVRVTPVSCTSQNISYVYIINIFKAKIAALLYSIHSHYKFSLN